MIIIALNRGKELYTEYLKQAERGVADLISVYTLIQDHLKS